MAAQDLYATVTGVDAPLGIDIIEGYKNFSQSCTITCSGTTLSLGDEVVIDMGYVGDHGVIFTGVVKKIHKATPDNVITITCFDTLVKASDYFMASDDPEDPFSRANIDAADLVGDLLELATVTNYTPVATNFIFTAPEFNLVSIADAIGQINGILAYHLWSDPTGEVFFADRRPYVMGSDTPILTFTTGSSGNIITNEYTRSDDDLRNKVVVYGLDPIRAEASTSSPYLPVGFYKTVVIASPLITEQQMAQDSADFNLELYNRLTRIVSCEALGDYRAHVNNVITITEAHTGVSGDWFIYSLSHSFNEGGYTMRMVLRA